MSIHRTPIAIDAASLPVEALELSGLEHEPVVIVETTEQGELVRKLTPPEKNDYQKRTGKNVFFASEQEFDEAMLAVAFEDQSSDGYR
jgi:hypothetical protein